MEGRIQHRAESAFFLMGLRKDLFGEGLVKERLIICVISDSSVNIRRDYRGGNPQLVRLIHHMQESVFIDEPYQLISADLIEIVIGQIQVLNTELVSVKMQLQYIEKYKHNAAFVC